jgi:glycerol-3-phosphate dehydrogenase (NAD(P)+)
MARPNVAVIGGGAWGVALAAAAARTAKHGETTLLYSRRAHDGQLPRGVSVTTELADAAKRARLIFLAVPSQHTREVARALGDHVDGRHYVVHGVRGLAGPELSTVAEIIRQETPVHRVGALGGPALADDLIAGKPGVIVCGSHYPEVTNAVCDAFACSQLRVYTTDDLKGLEWASALVGCLAIGVGYAQGVGLGAGLSAAVIARSIGEAARIAEAAGGDERTLLGLAGYGDLLASIAQHERPEVALGEALAKGASVEHALRDAKQRVEAVELIPRVVTWAEKHGVRAPIFRALTTGVLTSQSPRAIVDELMTAPITDRA